MDPDNSVIKGLWCNKQCFQALARALLNLPADRGVSQTETLPIVVTMIWHTVVYPGITVITLPAWWTGTLVVVHMVVTGSTVFARIRGTFIYLSLTKINKYIGTNL